MRFRHAWPLGAVIVFSGCATAPALLDPKNDPSSATAAEGSSMVRSTSLMANAPSPHDAPPAKDSGDGMGNMKMPGMQMPAHAGDHSK